MTRIADFTNTGLGVTENTFDFLQKQNKELQDLLFQFLNIPTSGNIILIGIEEGAPDDYSKGWVSMDGVLLEVTAGIGTKIEIVEDIDAVAYDDLTNKDTYYHKYGNINGADGIDISAFTRFASFKVGTETIEGIFRKATMVEALAGTSDEVVLTPLKLQNAIRNISSAYLSVLHTDLEGLTTNDTRTWYWKSQIGSIHFVGDKLNCKDDIAANTVMFNMNAATRPPHGYNFMFDDLTFICPVGSTISSYSPPKIARVEIKKDGDVTLLDPLLEDDYIDIRGITFVTNN